LYSGNHNIESNFIKSEYLRPSIDWAGKVIVLIGKETKESDWVDWEIAYANKNGKQLIGVFAPMAGESNIPDSFEEYGDALVAWDNTADLISAIEGGNPWQSSDGSTRPYSSGGGVDC
jgi:hypothetical protein